jgi:hypothetical protein
LFGEESFEAPLEAGRREAGPRLAGRDGDREVNGAPAMRAVVILRFGDGEVLTVTGVPTPEPGPGAEPVPLAEVAAAHLWIESGRSTGKLVLAVEP